MLGSFVLLIEPAIGSNKMVGYWERHVDGLLPLVYSLICCGNKSVVKYPCNMHLNGWLETP